MNGRLKAVLIAVICAITIMILITAGIMVNILIGSDNENIVGDLDIGPQMLGEIEVEEYNGAKLGSSEDFQENSIKGPQHVDMETYRLNITGLVQDEMSYTYMEVVNDNQRYRKVVTLDCVVGWSVVILWDGLLVRDLIDQAGPLDSGKVLIFKAVDGYTTSLPIEYFYENDILIAFGLNNVTLSPERGFPFQLVAEMKWGYKWIKWINEIEISDDIDYEGYWEERGFDNTADVD